MADHFEETIGLRVTALEAEAQSVKEHFVELREFITFSLTTHIGQLRTALKQNINRLDERFDRIEGKMEAYHEATRLILADILDRLPPRNG